MMIPNVLFMTLFINHSLVGLSNGSHEVDMIEQISNCMRALVFEHRAASIYASSHYPDTRKRTKEEIEFHKRIDKPIERSNKTAIHNLKRTLKTF